jgi:hypothetical protein
VFLLHQPNHHRSVQACLGSHWVSAWAGVAWAFALRLRHCCLATGQLTRAYSDSGSDQDICRLTLCMMMTLSGWNTFQLQVTSEVFRVCRGPPVTRPSATPGGAHCKCTLPLGQHDPGPSGYPQLSVNICAYLESQLITSNWIVCHILVISNRLCIQKSTLQVICHCNLLPFLCCCSVSIIWVILFALLWSSSFGDHLYSLNHVLVTIVILS